MSESASDESPAVCDRSVCYLCGRPLIEDITRDHVPPDQFFPASLKESGGIQLVTLPSHYACNHSYCKDEEYFVQSLGILAIDCPVGKELEKDIRRRSREPGRRPLYEMVRKEFNLRPGGLYLPRGMVAKDFNWDRVERVGWKIVRGLFFYHMQGFLPECTPINLVVLGPGDELSQEDKELYFQLDAWGRYPDVFTYSFCKCHDQDVNGYGWFLRFWQSLLMRFIFHDPQCACAQCAEARSAS